MNLFKKLTTATSACALVLGSTAAAFAEGELNILTWEGYADESFIAPFTEATSCRVNATYVGSNDDFAPKLAAGGGVYDLISPSIDATTVLIEAGFLAPIDTGRITEWDNIYEKFRTAEAFSHEGDLYAVPFAWGAIAFMYRNDQFETPPTSLRDLWSAENSGLISLWDDKSSIYVASRMIGNTDIYNLSDEELAAAQAALIEQKPLVRKYWATAGELVDLYVSGEVAISNTWAGYQSSLIAAEGIEVTEFIPEEGAEGWIDSFLLVKNSPNEDCAYQFLNMMVSEQGQCGVANVNGYSVANPVAARKCMTPEQFTSLHQDDLAYLDNLLLWENLGDRIGAYTDAWNAVKSQ